MEIKGRPEVLTGVTRVYRVNCGKVFVTVNHLNGEIFEVFVSVGKSGSCITAMSSALGRVISYALRGGIDPKNIVKMLKGVSCEGRFGFGAREVLSCSDAIGKAIEYVMETIVRKEEKNGKES